MEALFLFLPKRHLGQVKECRRSRHIESGSRGNRRRFRILINSSDDVSKYGALVKDRVRSGMRSRIFGERPMSEAIN